MTGKRTLEYVRVRSSLLFCLKRNIPFSYRQDILDVYRTIKRISVAALVQVEA
jgi:hypothetical protein